MTINDLLDIAIQHEVSSQHLYDHLRGEVKDAKAKEFLSELYEEEKNHENLLLMVKEMEMYDGTLAFPDESLPDAVHSSHDTSDIPGPDATIEQIMDLALQREHRAIQIFRHLAAHVEAGELKTLFTNLEREEEHHHYNIQKKFAIRDGSFGFEM